MSQSQDLADTQRRLLREFLTSQKLTQQEVADILGIRQTNVSALLRGERNFGKKMAERWSNAFGLRVNWLLTGEGPMFDTDKADTTSESTTDTPTPPAPSELDELIPIVPRDVAMMPNTSIWEYMQNSTDVNAQPKVHQFPRYDFYFQCVTDAMRPEIYAGDLLGIRRLEPGAPLINGETYVFDTKSAGMQIRMLEEKEDGYLATAHNDRYKDTFFPRSEVLSIFTIVGLVRVK
jgi:transcriptional regulator with XRE-family HTH domain